MSRGPELRDQTVVVMGRKRRHRDRNGQASAGGGADVILTGRNPEPLQRAASELDASMPRCV